MSSDVGECKFVAWHVEVTASNQSGATSPSVPPEDAVSEDSETVQATLKALADIKEWNGKYALERDSFEEEEPLEDRAWTWT